jgi:hypothetical protein
MSAVTSVKIIISAVTRDKLGANGKCTNGNQAHKRRVIVATLINLQFYQAHLEAEYLRPIFFSKLPIRNIR